MPIVGIPDKSDKILPKDIPQLISGLGRSQSAIPGS